MEGGGQGEWPWPGALGSENCGGGTCEGPLHPLGSLGMTIAPARLGGGLLGSAFSWELGWKKQTQVLVQRAVYPSFLPPVTVPTQASGAQGAGGDGIQTHRPLEQALAKQVQAGGPARSAFGKRQPSYLLVSLTYGREQYCYVSPSLWGRSEGPSVFPAFCSSPPSSSSLSAAP